jgi:hypothetical protein
MEITGVYVPLEDWTLIKRIIPDIEQSRRYGTVGTRFN